MVGDRMLVGVAEDAPLVVVERPYADDGSIGPEQRHTESRDSLVGVDPQDLTVGRVARGIVAEPSHDAVGGDLADDSEAHGYPVGPRLIGSGICRVDHEGATAVVEGVEDAATCVEVRRGGTA